MVRDMIGYTIGALLEMWSFVLIYWGVFGIPIKTHVKDVIKINIAVILLGNIMYCIGAGIQSDNLLGSEIVVCICSVWMMYERRGVRISAYVMAYIIYSIADNICIIFIQRIFGIQPNLFFQGGDVWIRVGEKLSAFLLCVFIGCVLKRKMAGIYQLISWRVYLLIVISLFGITLFLALVTCGIFQDERRSAIVLDKLMFPAILSVFFVVLLCSCIVLMLKKEELQQCIMQTLRKKNEQQEQYGQILCQKTEALQKMRHDIHHHINYMYQAMVNEQYEEVREYLEDLKNEQNIIKQEYDQYFGNQVLDTIMYAMEQSYKSDDISISCKGKVKNNLNIDHIDLCAVFSNLLENAIEACEGCLNDREIIIVASEYQDAFVLEISNPYNQSILKDVIRTSKKNLEEHGFGIQIVREIVEKYQGELNVLCTDDRFYVKVIMHEK